VTREQVHAQARAVAMLILGTGRDADADHLAQYVLGCFERVCTADADQIRATCCGELARLFCETLRCAVLSRRPQ
jgi:hypothetical protein